MFLSYVILFTAETSSNLQHLYTSVIEGLQQTFNDLHPTINHSLITSSPPLLLQRPPVALLLLSCLIILVHFEQNNKPQLLVIDSNLNELYSLTCIDHRLIIHDYVTITDGFVEC
ncbi:hypothetical protein CHARACLAT_010247 [Characodon lateralis]|uniref:Uncharacterized protein n=1 Tax=Characodon lateralis TaxID=208331 RepID=A0ABU7F4B5_9TELE|nr:hypothetical protein [Characodon lateralis]